MIVLIHIKIDLITKLTLLVAIHRVQLEDLEESSNVLVNFQIDGFVGGCEFSIEKKKAPRISTVCNMHL